MPKDENDSTYTLRVDSRLKQLAEGVAAKNDLKLAQVLRKAMRDYVAAHPEDAEEVMKKLK